MMTKDYRLTAKIQNNLILTAIEEAGYSTVLDFCRQMKISPSPIYNFINMKEAGRTADGLNWRESAKNLAAALGVNPEDLFNEQQRYTRLDKNNAIRELSEEDIGAHLEHSVRFDLEEHTHTPDEPLLEKETKKAVEQYIADLTPRERKVIRMRFGLPPYGVEHTYDIIGKEFDLTTERIRQIEAKALRKLRFPSRAIKMKDIVPTAWFTLAQLKLLENQ